MILEEIDYLLESSALNFKGGARKKKFAAKLAKELDWMKHRDKIGNRLIAGTLATGALGAAYYANKQYEKAKVAQDTISPAAIGAGTLAAGGLGYAAYRKNKQSK